MIKFLRWLSYLFAIVAIIIIVIAIIGNVMTVLRDSSGPISFLKVFYEIIRPFNPFNILDFIATLMLLTPALAFTLLTLWLENKKLTKG